MSALRMLATSNVKPYVPPPLVTLTFTSSTSWTPPFGVTMLQTLTGKGSDGGASSPVTQNFIVTHLSYSDFFGGDSPGNFTFEYAASTANNALQTLGATSPYWNEWTLQQFSGGRNSYATIYHLVPDFVYGSARLIFPENWQSGGGLVSSGTSASWDIRLSYDVWGPPTMGLATVAFGKEFLGAYGGPSTPVTHNGVPVSPGTPYNFTIYPGGYVTITYQP